MVVQNTTVSHVSPSISYIPGMLWFEGIPADDPDLSYYDTQSYHATNGTMGAASVSFHWDGLGEVWVFGGWRERLGSYNVTLDGATTEVNGFQGGADNFDAVLFHGFGLLPGKHQIELVNTGNDTQHSVLDINHITFQSSLGDPSIIDDTDSRCMWSGEWVPNNVSRTTWDSLGQMWMNFSGIGFELWGSTGSLNSPFSITLDGWTSQSLTSNTRVNTTSQSHLLFFQHNLTVGNHTILIRNNPAWSNMSGAPTALDIDYTRVYSTVDAASISPASLSKKKNTAAIVSSALGGVAFLLLLSLAFLFYRRHSNMHRKRRLLRPSPYQLTAIPQSPDSPNLDRHLDRPSETNGAPLRPQKSISSSVMGALTTLSNWSARLQQRSAPQKVDHSPSHSLDLDFFRKAHDALGDEESLSSNEISEMAYSVLVNAPSSPLESPQRALSRHTKADILRGHGGMHKSSSSMESALNSQFLSVSYTTSIPSRFTDGAVDSPMDPTLPSTTIRSHPTRTPQTSIPTLSSPPSSSTLSDKLRRERERGHVPSLLSLPTIMPLPVLDPSLPTITVDPVAAFAAVREASEAEESLMSAGTGPRKTRPLPVPKAIDGDMSRSGSTSSEPPPYQPYQLAWTSS